MQDNINIPRRLRRSLLLIAAAGCFVLSHSATAQISNVWAPSIVGAGEPANIVVDWEGRKRISGFEIVADFDVTGAMLTCSDQAPSITTRSSASGYTTRILARTQIRTDCKVIVGITSASETDAAFSIRPIIPQTTQSRPVAEPVKVDRTIQVVNRPVSTDNSVARFSEALESPLATEVELRLDMPFTTELWLQTVSTGRIIASTWDGDESRSYPIELVVEPAGRLVFYSGEPGRHESMSSSSPVADGQWHHIAIANDASRNVLKMFIDGVGVDSLFYSSQRERRAGNLTIAGRNVDDDAFTRTAFTGSMDEVRIWSSTRTAVQIQESMSRSQISAPTLEYSLAFNREDFPTNGLSIVRSSLDFDASVDDLTATVFDRDVTLQWTAPDTDVAAFEVEESLDGNEFESIATYSGGQSSGTSISHTETVDQSGVVYYRVKQAYRDGSHRYSATLKIGMGETNLVPDLYLANYPNPFDRETTISFEVEEEQHVTLSVWDVTGQSVVVLVDDQLPAGMHEAVFSAADLPSGVYFARLAIGARIESHKLTVAR